MAQLLVDRFNRSGYPSGSRRVGPSVSAPRLNVRAVEIPVPGRSGPQQAPDPLRYGDTPARPAAQQVFQELRPASWRSVMRDEWAAPLGEIDDHTEVELRVSQPRGRQHAFRERANIEPPEAEAYGSGFALRARLFGAASHLIPVPTG